ncbi:MAG TPA: Gfo/Idh/MocA family oxidoreductase [Fimbriimonas sp.]
MAEKLRWGILGTGSIARQFGGGLRVSKTGELAAVGSRSIESAMKFASEFGGTPHGSYADLLGDPNVDAVYIATPHHLHMEHTIATAQAGKGILCEKPFTLNALEAQRALAEVRKAGVFFMEAFMYRCHPQTIKLGQLIREGAIGKPLNVNSEFGFHARREGWDNFRANGALGGGGLMDVGTYCVSLSRYVAGEEPDVLHYTARIGEKGYDETGSGCMAFPGGMNAHFGTGVHVDMRNDAWVYGESGMIHLENPWKVSEGSKMTLRRRGAEPEVFDLGGSNDQLYAYEADAVAEFFERRECPYVTLDDTLGQMRALDALRRSVGLTFEAEMKA